jgi:hypothetical protein
MARLKGFRVGSDLYNQQIKNIVSDEDRGFLLAGFFGGAFGGFCGAVFSFGLGAILF